MRNNEDRLGARQASESDAPKMPNPMDYVTPTEFIELPSKGQYYPEGHPLRNKETVEIRFMTAKDEDILTSRALLKKGVALDRLINNLVVEQGVDASSMLIGDRNAVVIAARASAYGHIYKTTAACPSCTEKSKHSFNLLEPTVYDGSEHEDYDITHREDGLYDITLPYSKIVVTARQLIGTDETKIVQRLQRKTSKKEEIETTVTDQMLAYIVAVNHYPDQRAIKHVVHNLIAKETRYLRNAYAAITPDLKITGDFECPSCGHEQELEVPFGADFFWPDR